MLQISFNIPNFASHNKPKITAAKPSNIPTLKKPLNKDTVSFGCTSSLSLQGFKQLANKKHPNLTISQVLKNAVSDENNFLGKGREASVYKIPKLDDYVIRVLHSADRKTAFEKDFIPRLDISTKYNFGQPIAENNEGIFILKKVEGTAHSFKDWVPMNKAVKKGLYTFSKKDCHEFIQKIKKLDTLEQEAFNDFARKVKYLNEHTIYKIDIINPNNILIDYKNKEINVVDLSHKSTKGMEKPYSGIDDMVLVLLDSQNHKRIYDSLSDKDKKTLKAISESVIKKCLTAGKNAGLTRTEENVYKFFHSNGIRVGNKYLGRSATTEEAEKFFLQDYYDFRELYKDKF